MNWRHACKLFLLSCLSFLLVGCNPKPDFTVSPTQVVAGVEATFDGSATVIANTNKGNAAVSYSWKFGDGSTGSGKVVKHTYAQAGTYTVKLTVVDKVGKEGSFSAPVVVVAAPAAVANLTVQVQGADGALVGGAQVKIGNASVQSNAQGVASLTGVPAGADKVVQVSKAGFVNQAVRTTLTAGKTQNLLVTLRPLSDPLSIAQIQNAQTINSPLLGASVTLPANALVTPDNQVATGAVTLYLTPWDIADIDLNAMLGNGRARDAQGNLTDLISAGMMTVDFYDAQGRKLQLSSSASADIQMDLPRDSINNTPLAVGATIPLWTFDEAQGLWIEEGQGTVVASSTSPVGLAVKATVRHFSTWNWDFKFQNAGSVTVSCVDTAVVACNVVAEVTLADGSTFTKSSSLGAEVTTIINMPTDGSIRWTASTPGGQVGTTVSGTSGNVVIQLSAPTTSNFVQCTLADGSAADCNVDLEAPLADGSTETRRFFVPAGGVQVKTALATSGPLQWKGSSRLAVNAAGDVVRFEGTASSALTGNVNLSLSTEVAAAGKRLFVGCEAQALVNLGTEALASCTVTVQVYTRGERLLGEFDVTGVAGSTKAVVLPVESEGGFVIFRATGTTVTGVPVNSFGSFFNVDELAPDQTIRLQTRDVLPT